MQVKDAKELKPGDRVKWDDGTLGTVRELTYGGRPAVKIEWDDRLWAVMAFDDKDAPWECLRRVPINEEAARA